MIRGLIDLVKIEMLLSGRPDNFDVPHDLNPEVMSLHYPLVRNSVQSTREIIGPEPLQ
jgi:hypothetical protein